MLPLIGVAAETFGATEALGALFSAVTALFIGKSVSEFSTDNLIDVDFTKDDDEILQDYQKYRDNLVKEKSEEVAEKNKEIPSKVKDSIKTKTDLITNTLKDVITNIEKPEITTHQPEQKTSTASTNESLVEVLIKNNNDMLEAIHEQSLIMQSIQDSLKILAENSVVKMDIESGKLSQQANQNVISNHQLELLSSTLPSINHSLAHLPLILQALDITAQSSVAQTKVLLGTNRAEWTKAERLYDIQKHQEKQANLAHYELNEEITDSAGNKTTPAKARAQKHAEESLSHKLENSITPDDLDFSDMDLNIFEEVIKIMKEEREDY